MSTLSDMANVSPHPRNPFPGLTEPDMTRTQLLDLEEWGRQQRRDAVQAVLDGLPGPLRVAVRLALPWVP